MQNAERCVKIKERREKKRKGKEKRRKERAHASADFVLFTWSQCTQAW
jgi:hypothetical protein